MEMLLVKHTQVCIWDVQLKQSQKQSNTKHLLAIGRFTSLTY